MPCMFLVAVINKLLHRWVMSNTFKTRSDSCDVMVSNSIGKRFFYTHKLPMQSRHGGAYPSASQITGKSPHCWLLVAGIYHGSPYKGPVRWKACPYHNNIMVRHTADLRTYRHVVERDAHFTDSTITGRHDIYATDSILGQTFNNINVTQKFPIKLQMKRVCLFHAYNDTAGTLTEIRES